MQGGAETQTIPIQDILLGVRFIRESCLNLGNSADGCAEM